MPALLSGVSATVIDAPQLAAFQLPQVTDYLRLTPGISVATSGPLGAQTSVFIRGANSNQTLVFIDGIPSNDPASSSAFLFNTLPTDGVARVEILRGPQSALWGSEAIGGVIAVTTPAPPAGERLSARIEGGSLGTYRAAAEGGIGNDIGGVSATASYLATDGIPIATNGVIRNGFDNLTFSAKGVLHPSPQAELGAVVRYTDATSRYDDASSGVPVDARNATTNRALAVRAYADARPVGELIDLHIESTYLDTNDLNRDTGIFQNATAATRLRFVGQASLNLKAGALTHRLTGAAEYEEQRFVATGPDFGIPTDQRVRRNQTSGIGEYRVQYSDRAAASVSVRHDVNSGFANATTVRAAASARLPAGFDLHGSYGEGVSDPTFTQQFGFFPGLFVGNPLLRPERSKGFDAGAGWRVARGGFDVTYFKTDLTNPFVDTFVSLDSGNTFLESFVNGTGRSHRQGVEVAADAKPLDWLRVSATYTYLDATQPTLPDGSVAKELRRARHSGSASVTAERDRATLAFTAAYIGDRADNNFATFPATPVTLGSYWLGSVSGTYRLTRKVELTGRVENAFNSHYQDAFGYRTPGITAYGGVRLAFGKK